MNPSKSDNRIYKSKEGLKISRYLTENGITTRSSQIDVIQDYLQGNVFEWWYQFFVSTPKENCIDTKNTFEKQLIYLDYMTSIVDTISLMCPIPTSFEKSNGLSDSMSKKLIDKLK